MKKPRPGIPSPLATHDETLGCCQNIETIARLLQICGRVGPGEPLPPQLVAYAGAMIERETRNLRNYLKGQTGRVALRQRG